MSKSYTYRVLFVLPLNTRFHVIIAIIIFKQIKRSLIMGYIMFSHYSHNKGMIFYFASETNADMTFSCFLSEINNLVCISKFVITSKKPRKNRGNRFRSATHLSNPNPIHGYTTTLDPEVHWFPITKRRSFRSAYILSDVSKKSLAIWARWWHPLRKLARLPLLQRNQRHGYLNGNLWSSFSKKIPNLTSRINEISETIINTRLEL